MEYAVLFASSESVFNQHVTEELNQGWKPLGGVSVIVLKNGDVVYHQAVVKKVD